MTGTLVLEGFRRLAEVCHKSALPLDCLVPGEPPIAPGESFLGQPFDPLLAALYAQTDGAVLGELKIYPIREPENVVLKINRSMRRFGEEPYLSALLFGQIPLLAYYFATVPALADSEGIQPIIFIDGYENDQVFPVASSLDKFLMAFSVYLERAVAMPEFIVERRVGLHFPQSILDVVARDALLIEALSSGLFERLIDSEESREWVSNAIGVSR